MSSVCSHHSKHSGSHLSPAAAEESSEAKRKSGNWGDVPNAPERIRSAAEAGFGKASEADAFVRSSTLRMSYQQATGHVTSLENGEDHVPSFNLER